MSSSDPFEIMKLRVTKALAGFSKKFPEGQSRYDIASSKPDKSDFPVPDLVLFMMRNVMGWEWSGHGEKVRWTVYGSFKGLPVILELFFRKFGFAIGMEAGEAKDRQRLVNQLKTALRHVETFLAPIAQHQVSLGEASIANRFSEFESRYRFFREMADKAYAEAKKRPKKRKAKEGEVAAEETAKLFMSDMVLDLNRSTRANQGFYYSTAMVDAYFSLLEHRLRPSAGVQWKTLGGGRTARFPRQQMGREAQSDCFGILGRTTRQDAGHQGTHPQSVRAWRFRKRWWLDLLPPPPHRGHPYQFQQVRKQRPVLLHSDRGGARRLRQIPTGLMNCSPPVHLNARIASWTLVSTHPTTANRSRSTMPRSAAPRRTSKSFWTAGATNS